MGENVPFLDNSAYAYELGEYKQYDHELLLRAELEELSEDDLFSKYSYEQGLLRKSANDHLQVVATGRIISKIIENCIRKSTNKEKKIWCDSDASYRLVYSYLSGKYKATLSSVDRSRKDWACSLAKDIATVGMVACKLCQISITNTIDKYVSCRDVKGKCEDMAAWV